MATIGQYDKGSEAIPRARRVVSYDGTALAYTCHGPAASGAPVTVLFTHGFGSGAALWDAQIPALVRRGYRCITWDMRGHAASQSPKANDDTAPHRYSKWSQVMDMKAVLAAAGVVPLHARRHVGETVLVLAGHSMGGMDTMLFACHFPGVADALVLYGTGPGFRSDKGRLKWNATAEKIAAKYDRQGLDALVGSDRTKGHTSAAGLAAACRGNFAQRDDDPYAMARGGPNFLAREGLAQIAQPTVILIGQYDKGFGRASDMMTKALPEARLARIPGAGHMMCEKNSDAFNAALLDGLDWAVAAVAKHRKVRSRL
jgi:pimeloyl-ACP methyl ester carboxylesterase